MTAPLFLPRLDASVRFALAMRRRVRQARARWIGLPVFVRRRRRGLGTPASRWHELPWRTRPRSMTATARHVAPERHDAAARRDAPGRRDAPAPRSAATAAAMQAHRSGAVAATVLPARAASDFARPMSALALSLHWPSSARERWKSSPVPTPGAVVLPAMRAAAGLPVREITVLHVHVFDRATD